jgi:hypothetical protein
MPKQIKMQLQFFFVKKLTKIIAMLLFSSIFFVFIILPNR